MPRADPTATRSRQPLEMVTNPQSVFSCGADVNAQGGPDGNALQAAARKGNELIVRLLLDHGVDFNAQGGEHDSALRAATREDFEFLAVPY